MSTKSKSDPPKLSQVMEALKNILSYWKWSNFNLVVNNLKKIFDFDFSVAWLETKIKESDFIVCKNQKG